MATLPGGPSNTIPSEFQSLWIARLLLDVLAERVRAIEIEPATGDTYKAECFVHMPDGTVEAHQCKMHQASEGKWTAAELCQRGVLQGVLAWLEQDTAHRFTFVSADGVPGLRDLCRRARDIQSLADFWAASETNEVLRSDRKTLVQLLKVDTDQSDGQRKIKDFCSRFRVELRPDETHRRDVEDRADALVLGDAAACVKLLEKVANTTYQRTLRPPDVAKLLREAGFELSDLSKHTGLLPTVDAHNERFHTSISPLLLRGKVLQRDVTEKLIEAGRNGGARVLLVHGAGGSGKTGVIYEAIQQVHQAGDPYLVLSLNQDELHSRASSPELAERILALPVESLQALAHGQTAWLFLDQLDAIRWTAHHSADALQQVREIVRRLSNAPDVRLVIACRTFDAQDDDGIRTLFESADKSAVGLERIKVPALSPEERDEILGELGINGTALSDRQRELLRNPQTLWLLSRLVDEAGTLAFNSLADLNGKFWSWVRRKQLTESEHEELDTRFLPSLLEHDLGSSGARVPQTLADRHPGLIAKLQSIGILTRSGRSTRFAHQSHYDYLAAVRMAETIGNLSDNLVDWCQRHEDLFHRNQLRQYLELLRADDAARFATVVAKILSEENIRFHLRAVALGVFGGDIDPHPLALNLVETSLEDEILRPHVLMQAQLNTEWFKHLCSRGLLEQWLVAEDIEFKTAAVNLLQAHCEHSGSGVLAILDDLPQEQADAVRGQIYRGAQLSTLPKSVFDDCLDWFKRTTDTELYFDWKRLAKATPRRAVDMLDAVLRRVMSPEGAAAPAGDVNNSCWLLRSASEEMHDVASRYPIHILHTCGFALDKLMEMRQLARTRRRAGDYPSYDERRHRQSMAGVVLKFAVAAGRSLAERRPRLALQLAEDSAATANRLRHRVAVMALRALPREFADQALQFLISHPNHLTSGKRRSNSIHRGSSTIPARNLIRRFTKYASDDIVSQLENVVRKVVPSWELRDFRTVHEIHMGRGYFGDGTTFSYISRRTFFATSYLLLDAFPDDRLSDEGQGRLGVLREKFGPVDTLVPDPPMSIGGVIGPSIPRERSRKMSDKQWLRLMTDKKTLDPSRARRWRDLTESSPRQFAGLLGDAVQCEPVRFAKLTLCVPIDTPAAYASAILRGLSRTTPPENEDSKEWMAATISETEAALHHLASWLPDRDVASAICWLIQRRSAEDWTEKTLRLLEKLIRTHEDPKLGQVPVQSGSGDKLEPNYVASALNCVRGAACGAWCAILWNRPSLHDRTWTLLEHLTHDSHPAVRVAALDICVPMLNVDRKRTMGLCRTLVKGKDDAVLVAYGLNTLLRYTARDDEMRPVISMMMCAGDEEVAMRGAAWTCIRYLLTGLGQDKVEAAMALSSKTREGVADVLGRYIGEHLENAVVLSWHEALLNDDEGQVRSKAASFVRSEKTIRQLSILPVLRTYISSKAFGNSIGGLTHTILTESENVSHLSDIVVAIVERMIEVKMEMGHDFPMTTYKLHDLVLRMYEDCQGQPAAHSACLDVIDSVIKEQLAYDLLPKID